MDIPSELNTFIFDLDGTLVDTEPLYTEAGQQVIAQWGHTFDPELKRRTMGGAARKSAAIIIEHYELPLTVDEFLTRRREILERLFPSAPEIKGASGLLAYLQGRGARLGLATSSHRDLYELKLGGREWAHCFDAVICGDDPLLTRPKPDPQIFELCAEALGEKPSRCVVFEDSPIGIRAATAAGMLVVAVASPHVERADLAEASIVVEDLDEARALLD